MKKRLAVWLSGALILTGLSLRADEANLPPMAPCSGHGRTRAGDVGIGDPISVSVKVKAGDRPWEQVKEGAPQLAETRYVCVGANIEFKVEASDYDKHVCLNAKTNFANYIRKTPLRVTVSSDDETRYPGAVFDLDTQAEEKKDNRQWQNTWRVPAAAAGRVLTFRLSGQVEDWGCDAYDLSPKGRVRRDHRNSKDPPRDMGLFAVELIPLKVEFIENYVEVCWIPNGQYNAKQNLVDHVREVPDIVWDSSVSPGAAGSFPATFSGDTPGLFLFGDGGGKYDLTARLGPGDACGDTMILGVLELLINPPARGVYAGGFLVAKAYLRGEIPLDASQLSWNVEKGSIEQHHIHADMITYTAPEKPELEMILHARYKECANAESKIRIFPRVGDVSIKVKDGLDAMNVGTGILVASGSKEKYTATIKDVFGNEWGNDHAYPNLNYIWHWNPPAKYNLLGSKDQDITFKSSQLVSLGYIITMAGYNTIYAGQLFSSQATGQTTVVVVNRKEVKKAADTALYTIALVLVVALSIKFPPALKIVKKFLLVPVPA